MAKVVICPSCQYQGSVPDEIQAKRIRCPKCKESFDVAAATQSSAPGAKRPAPAKRPAAAKTAFDDLDSVEPLPTLSNSGTRRAPVAAHNAGAGSGQSPMVYAALGVGGLAVVLLCVVLVVVLTRGNGDPPARVAGAAEAARPDAPARAEDSAITIEPVATRGADTSTVTATSVMENGDSAATTPVIDGPEIVRRLKESTVYLKNVVNGRTLASGTGFVIEVRGDTVMLATNRHVAVLDLSEVPARFVPKGSTVGIEAVFHSGEGPQSEQALPARIIAADTSDDFSTDLAFLIVKGVKRPPRPVNVFVKSDTTEGMAYTGAGFPLGGMLGKITESKGNPSVTITGGRIAALRRDDSGQLALFQVDGSLQPGNSGGPIVEEKTGKFVGVAVAKVGAVDTIGFVVPAAEVRRALGGRVGSIDGTRLEGTQGTADLQVRAEVVDPRGLVKSVMVHIAPASAGTISPKSDGSWPPLPHTEGVELQRDPKTPQYASGRVKVALSGQGADARKVLIQTAHRDVRGTLVYSKPREVELPEKGPFGRGGKLQRAMKAVQHKSLALLGPLLDPDNDCKLFKDEDKLTIKIDVPGKLHTLSPEMTTRKNRKVSLNNAPITMTEVEGDFAAFAQVTGEISPGSATPKDRQGHTLPFTVQSAGLILYQDKANFLRLERAGSIFINSLTPVHRLIIEAVKDGKQAMRPIYLDVPEANTLLVLVRRKGRVTCMFSPNGGETTYMFKEFALDLPTKVNVGLTAANISAKPFSATFDTFALINDVTMIDDELGEAQKPPAKKQ